MKISLLTLETNITLHCSFTFFLEEFSETLNTCGDISVTIYAEMWAAEDCQNNVLGDYCQ